MTSNRNSSKESWTTSEENSSGNEYSLKTKHTRKKDDEDVYSNLKRKKKKKHKRHKRRKKGRKKRDESENESDKSCLSEESTTLSNDACETTINILPALLQTSNNTEKRSEPQTINILPAILNHDELRDSSNTSDQALESGKDLLRDIMKVINEQETKRKDLMSESNSYNSVSRVTSRRQAGSRSRSRDHSRSRSFSRRGQRSCSRSRHHSRSRSRNRRRSGSDRHSRSRSGGRRHRKSSSRSRHHSRSRSRNRRSSGSDRHSRSRSRGRRHRRSSSRSRHHSKKSRSHSKNRKKCNDDRHSRSRSRSRHQRSGGSRSRSPKSAWDLMYVPSNKNYSSYKQNSSSNGSNDAASKSSDVKKQKSDDGPVFMNTTVHVKKSIDIKIPDLNVAKNESSTNKNTDVRSSMFGKWEKYEPSGGHHKELQNLTKLCQNISAKENLPDDEMDIVDEKEENNVHHPFKVAPAPMYLPQNYFHKHVPTNPAQAIMAGTMKAITGGSDPPLTGPLEKHFPVSSGTDHRKKEHADTEDDKHLPVFEAVPAKTEERIDVSAVIARRLGAQQILTKNPDDYSAKLVLAECDIKLKRWSDQNKKPGKFTGEVGTRMNKNDIAGVIETWVRKDFFHNLSPVTGGIGQRMMEKMGWQQGTPLGRNQEGFIAPLALDVKVGRGGLQSVDEEAALRRGPAGKMLPKKRLTLAPVTNVNGKHPVSALAELCTKQRLGVPTYELVFEHGQAHNKNFLMKVTVQDVDYQASVASPNKKHAKAQAAITALRIMGALKE